MPGAEARCHDCGYRSLGSGASSYRLVSSYRPVPGGWTWLRMPAALLGVLKRERTWQPNPLVYTVGAGVGLVVGTAADLAIGIPWWIGPAVGLGVLFGLSLVGAVRGSSRSSLRVQLMQAYAPERYVRVQREEERAVLASGLPAVGLAPIIDCARMLGGTSRSGDVVAAVSLLHWFGGGPRPQPDDPEVRVEVSREAATAESLVDWLARETSRPSGSPDEDDPRPWFEERHRRSRGLREEMGADGWRRHTIAVDGGPVAFSVMARSGAWVATATWHDASGGPPGAHGTAPWG